MLRDQLKERFRGSDNPSPSTEDVGNGARRVYRGRLIDWLKWYSGHLRKAQDDVGILATGVGNLYRGIGRYGSQQFNTALHFVG